MATSFLQQLLSPTKSQEELLVEAKIAVTKAKRDLVKATVQLVSESEKLDDTKLDTAIAKVEKVLDKL